MAKPERRDPAKERHWRQLLREWRRSGLTGRDFCAEQGLSEPSFYAWRREIARRDREKSAGAGTEGMAKRARRGTARSARRRSASVEAKPPTFMRVTVSGGGTGGTGATGGIPASVIDASTLEVVVSDRRVLRVRAGFDADLLRQLLRVLEEHPQEGSAC